MKGGEFKLVEVDQEEKDKVQETGMALISYIGPLCLIPLFITKKKDDFLRFHLQQGLLLFLIEVAVWFFFGVLFGSSSGWGWQGWGAFGITGTIYSVASLGLLVLSLIGILNVINGEKKELPLIGRYAKGLRIV